MKGNGNLNRGNLRKATIFLTGHVALNYHLNKFKPDKISKTCPHCLAAEETTDHYNILDSVRSDRLRGVQSSTHSILASQKWYTISPFLLS